MWRLAAFVWLLCVSQAAAEAVIVKAEYADPTDRYGHGVLGDDIEYGALRLTLSDGKVRRFVLPETLVFEDVVPRVVDVGGPLGPEVIVVESSNTKGGRLVVYGADGRLARTPFIGRAFRWLAPVGADDLDGDGAVEIVFVDRPHLAKTLRIWRFDGEGLTEVAALKGVTNHRIGEDYISGGIRDCGDGPEMIVADANWQNIVAVQFDGQAVSSKILAKFRGRESFAKVLDCKN